MRHTNSITRSGIMTMMKERRAYIRVTRRLVQAGFLLLTVLICIKLYAFVFQYDLASGYSGPPVERPTGVDVHDQTL